MIEIYIFEECHDILSAKNFAINSYLGKKKLAAETLKYTEKGKPYLQNCEISITHTKNILLVALCDYPLGIDIESIGRKINIMPCIQDWTAMEAYCKFLGTGVDSKKKLSLEIDKKKLFQFELFNRYAVSVYCQEIQYELIYVDSDNNGSFYQKA